jgi:hypothetical protein
MTVGRVLLASVLVGSLAGVAFVAQVTEPSGAKMAAAAERFLDGLSPEQRTKAAFPFDDKERMNWHFIPLQDRARKPTRRGLPLGEMTADQKRSAMDLLKAGTSPGGDQKATTIMSLESILKELERGGAMVRDPGWYFFAVFGKPSANGKWGWRVEGHHLSLNFTVDNGRLVSATPAFFGANPATVTSGPRKGLRTLPEADDLARELFKALDEDQRKLAFQGRGNQFSEIAGRTPGPKVGKPKGLPASRMSADQRDLLVRLLRTYADRMPADVAEREMAEVREAGIDNIHFAYAGGLQSGEQHSYRIQGPTFLVEFLNVQEDSARNPANHIHSAWRSAKGDFGLAAR